MTLPQNLLTAALCLVLSGVSSTAEELPPPKMILFQKGLICHEPEQVKQFLDDVVEQKGLPEPMTDGCSLRHGANMPVLATPLEWHDNQAAMSLLAKFDAGPHGIRYGYLAYIPNPDFKPAKADIDL